MAKSPTAVIASAALFLLAGAFGLLLGRWTHSVPAAEESEIGAAPTHDVALLIAELRRTNEAMLEVVRSNRLVRAESGPSREVVPSDSDEIRRLVAALERSNELLLERSSRPSPSAGVHEQWKGAGLESRDALAAWIKQARSTPDGRESGSIELSRLHTCWTRDDLFARYGRPTWMSPDECGLTITYGVEIQPDEFEWVAVFTTMDGVVTGSYVN